MKRYLFQSTLLVLLIVSNSTSYSQASKPRYEFGAGFGFLVYQGDLAPSQIGSFKTQRPAVGLFGARMLSSSFSIRAQFTIGGLRGDESLFDEPDYRQLRNFYFKTAVYEFSGLLVWDVLNRNDADKGFSPYAFAGAGLSFLNIKPDWSRVDTNYFSSENTEFWNGLAEDTAHSLPKVLPVLPVGIGTKYFLSPRWGLFAEANYRIIRTDHLDGFSKAVNPKHKDTYFGYQVGVIFRTGKQDLLGCPVIKY